MAERMMDRLSLFFRRALFPVAPRWADLNTMDMCDANEAVEARDLIEAEFSIHFTDPEIEAVRTMFDLFKLVWAKLPDATKQGEFPELAVWDRLCQQLRHITQYSGPIDLETAFFAEHAKARKHHG